MNRKKPKIKKIPTYSNGGLNKFGNALEDIGYGAADMTLSGVGMGNTIDTQYNTEAGQKFNQGLNQAQPLITGISDAIPIWGQIAKGGRQAGSQFNPEYQGTDQLQKQQMYADGGTVELEKQEIFKTPNGQIAGVNGNSHEQGGVPVNIPNQTKILSDKLKINGKTFADLGSKYKTVKEDKIMSDDKATSNSKATAKLTSEIKQKKLDQLFNAQESMKQTKLASYAKRLGVNLPQEQFKNGGIKKYPDGGQFSQEELEYVPTDFNYDFSSMNEQPKNESADYSQIGNYASMAANLAAPLYSLATNKKEAGINFVKPQIKYLDPSAELASNANSNAGVVNSIKEYSGGNAEQYMRGRIIQGSNNSQTNAATITRYNNANSEIYNRNQSEVASISNTEKDYNRRDEAAYRNINRAAVANLGENVSGVLRDNKATQQDYKTLGMISKMYKNFQYNQRTGEWLHKTNGSKLSQEEINKATE
jgi:hypothetical protein